MSAHKFFYMLRDFFALIFLKKMAGIPDRNIWFVQGSRN